MRAWRGKGFDNFLPLLPLEFDRIGTDVLIIRVSSIGANCVANKIEMSILPMLVNLADDLDELDLDNTRFTVGRWPQELQNPERRKIIPYHPAPYWQLDDCSTGGSEARMTKADGFQMTMDVSEFKAGEIEVKTVAHSVIVEGNHEEREDDHGFVSRHFVRRFEVPVVCDIRDVVSTLSSDGILVVRAPLKPIPETLTEERLIEVLQTGTTHHNHQHQQQQQQQKKRRHSSKGVKEKV